MGLQVCSLASIRGGVGGKADQGAQRDAAGLL